MKIEIIGTIYIIAAPSGGGKTSLVKRLIANDDKLCLSISHTTRSIRAGEIEGKDYFYVIPEVFNRMIKDGEFLEHATVFNNCYGTSKRQLLSKLESGFDVILEIDWQGARQVRQHFSNVVTIFILPPSYDILEQRLRLRKQDDEATINVRMSQAKEQILHCNEFDYVLFNEDFERCVTELQAIVTNQRLRYSQQCLRNAKLLSKLLESR